MSNKKAAERCIRSAAMGFFQKMDEFAYFRLKLPVPTR